VKRCRHVLARGYDNNGTTYGQDVFTWCFECMDYVPWGPANDTPEVLVEIRAAEIAARWIAPVSGFDDGPAELSIAEDIGWLFSIGCPDPGRDAPNDPAEWSGWLAREILRGGGGG